MLYASARLRSPGIILSFDSKHGPLSYPCDQYDRWEDNLRAIALSLEALRSVDRYGVTRRAEQYKGWARLPGPESAPGPFQSTLEAALFISKHSFGDGTNAPCIVASADYYREFYRVAAAKLHPDRNGGADAEFKMLGAAKQLLDKLHGL